MRGQDDRHALRLEVGHDRPHVAAQLHIDPRRRLVQKQHARLVGQRLGNQHPALHAARQAFDQTVFLVPQRQLSQHLFHLRRICGLAMQPARKADGIGHLLEGFQRNLLRHQPDQVPRRPKLAHHVMPADGDAARGRLHNAADRGNQRGLARTVRAQKGQDLALCNFKRDRFQRLEPGREGLGQLSDRYDRCHGAPGVWKHGP